jgi:transposase
MRKMVETEFIRKKHFIDGWSIRKISEHLGIARQTVRKAVASSDPPCYQRRKDRSSPVMDPYRAVIMSWLEQDQAAPAKQRHTAKRIYDRLVAEHGFTGHEATVRRLVARLRDQSPEVFIPLTASWGQQAQVDWGQAVVEIAGAREVAHLFCLRLRASAVAFAWAAPTEKLEAFLEGHVRAFAWLGGVPGECLYDNPKTAVVRILAGPERVEHTHFSHLRAHYLFDSLFCRPAEGHEKGAVENLVGYVRRNALVPVPSFASWEALNTHLLTWCTRDRERRAAAWEQERAALRALPFRTFDASIARTAHVNRLSLIRIDHNRYSVPCRYVGQVVEVTVSTYEVGISAKQQVVARHHRCHGRDQTILELEHYLPAIARKPRAVSHAAVVSQLPPIYAIVRDQLCRARRDGYREFAAMLLLCQEFPLDQVTHALGVAQQRGCLQVSAVRQLILNHRAPDRPDPVVVPARLAAVQLSLPDLAQYDTLIVKSQAS